MSLFKRDKAAFEYTAEAMTIAKKYPFPILEAIMTTEEGSSYILFFADIVQRNREQAKQKPMSLKEAQKQVKTAEKVTLEPPQAPKYGTWRID